jgi:hypothetical protein
MTPRALLPATLLLLPACAAPDRWTPFDTTVLYADLTGPAPTAQEAAPRPETPRTPITRDEQGRIPLSIEQAALLALENNRDLRVSRLTPEIAATFEDIERGRFDPELFARAEFGDAESVEISRATGELFSTERQETLAEVGVRQDLPTGTRIEAGVRANRSLSNRTPEQQAARVGLTLTQSLLRGFGPGVNLARV